MSSLGILFEMRLLNLSINFIVNFCPHLGRVFFVLFFFHYVSAKFHLRPPNPSTTSRIWHKVYLYAKWLILEFSFYKPKESILPSHPNPNPAEMDWCISQGHLHEEKSKQSHPGFEHGSSIPLPMIITIILIYL